ncbi:MAG: hypothetical protein QXT77_05370 [Candidatus Methanomethylicaceae archaeon]
MARLTQTALIGVVLTLSAAVYLLHSQNISLRAELAEIRAASASYKKVTEQKIAKTETEHEQAKTDIDSRYSAIINRLREQQDNNVRTVTIAESCESERDKAAERVRSELLGRLAEVARYADELRVVGLACETIGE